MQPTSSWLYSCLLNLLQLLSSSLHYFFSLFFQIGGLESPSNYFIFNSVGPWPKNESRLILFCENLFLINLGVNLVYFITINSDLSTTDLHSKIIIQLHVFQYCRSSILKFSSYGVLLYAVSPCEVPSHGWTFDPPLVQSSSKFDNSKSPFWL